MRRHISRAGGGLVSCCDLGFGGGQTLGIGAERFSGKFRDFSIIIYYGGSAHQVSCVGDE